VGWEVAFDGFVGTRTENITLKKLQKGTKRRASLRGVIDSKETKILAIKRFIQREKNESVKGLGGRAYMVGRRMSLNSPWLAPQRRS